MSNYKKISENISELIISGAKKSNPIKWLNIVKAQKKEIDYLRDNYAFNLPHLKAAIATVFSQRPMISQQDKYLFIILHFPIMHQGRIVAAEIEFFLGHGYLITVHNGNIPVLNVFYEMCKNKSKSLPFSGGVESSIILLYEILDRLIHDCYTLIDKTSININQAEEAIFANKQKAAVSLILNLRRNIINLRKILQNHEGILKRLTEVKSTLIPQRNIAQHYAKLVEHSKRIWNMLDNQKEMVEVLNSTNESLANDKMTNIMKTLTIISVITFPLTLIATMFSIKAGGTPLVANPYGFWIIFGIMLIGAMIMLLFFERKKWL